MAFEDIMEIVDKKVEEIKDKGCEFGRLTRHDVDGYRKDLNGLGNKLERFSNKFDKVYILLIGSLLTLAINLVVLVITIKGR